MTIRSFNLPLAEGGLNPQSFSKYSPSQYNGTAVLSASPSLWRVGAVGDSNARGAKMEKYKVWEIVLRPSNMNCGSTLGLDQENRWQDRQPSRWVAKGFSQIEGVGFNELFAAVAQKVL